MAPPTDLSTATLVPAETPVEDVPFVEARKLGVGAFNVTVDLVSACAYSRYRPRALFFIDRYGKVPGRYGCENHALQV